MVFAIMFCRTSVLMETSPDVGGAGDADQAVDIDGVDAGFTVVGKVYEFGAYDATWTCVVSRKT